MTTEWIDVGDCADVPDDEPIGVVVKGVPIALFRIGDGFAALHDLCTHGYAKLSEGYIEGDCIECPLHQGCFDIRTGAAVTEPATEPVQTYPVREVDGRLQVAV